jgi:hypothetical protein
MPSLLSGWLLTDVQVNNITTLHDTHGHIYIHHIGITILLPSYTSSPILGRPAGTDPSRLIHVVLDKYRIPLICGQFISSYSNQTLSWKRTKELTCGYLQYYFMSGAWESRNEFAGMPLLLCCPFSFVRLFRSSYLDRFDTFLHLNCYCLTARGLTVIFLSLVP